MREAHVEELSKHLIYDERPNIAAIARCDLQIVAAGAIFSRYGIVSTGAPPAAVAP